MWMKEEYIHNKQIKADYYLQIAINKQYILGYGVFTNPSYVTSFFELMEENFFRITVLYCSRSWIW